MSEPAAPADLPRRRIPAKLLLVGGGGAMLAAALGAATIWIFTAPAPRARPPAAAAAKATRAASPASNAAAGAQAAASAASVAQAPASSRQEEAPPVTIAASGAAQAAPPSNTQPVAAAASGVASGAPLSVAAPSAIAREAAAPRVERRGAPDETPIEHLRRRLGQVLGGRGQVESAPNGELRLVARRTAPDEAESAAAASPAHAVPGPWSYDGRSGPQAWGRLSPQYTACGAGRRQSPIDIRDGLALDLDPVRFDYRPGPFSVVDTGRTVQVEVPPGNTIAVAGRRYELTQLHFHRPSEERIDGRRHEMGLHLVHRDAEGRIAVVAVLLDRGAALPALQALWKHLPLETHDAVAVDAMFDPTQLLPADRRYFTYMGSLTTPPCTEGVRWVVMRQPVSLSPRQIDVFARLYPMNARPTQATAGRRIQQSN